jgi:single-stranded-DNA-specific exonuclease
MLRRVWEDVPADERRVSETAAALAVPAVIARLLVQRGFDDLERAHRFLHPAIEPASRSVSVDRHAPCRAPHSRGGGAGGSDRDPRRLRRRRRDIDGDPEARIELLGGNVRHFVPHRHRDGYGLQAATIERLHADGARLIVSVDCGIRATEAALRARELGVDLIITDHHEPEAALPPALAVLNPKRADCSYPDKMLAGVGVALKLVQALLSESGRGAEYLPSFLKIAAIGTLADVVPLTGENRVIAHCGLSALSRGPHAAGLEMLLAESGLAGKRLDSFHVSFILAPRLNAAGRMGSADAALDLLLIKGRDQASRDRAQTLARQLCEENVKRQAEEASIVADAKHLVEGDPDIGAQNLLVVAGDGWHRGVIGIAASKLVDAYHKPALVLSVADGIAHGSGRSIARFDLLEALESVHDVF